MAAGDCLAPGEGQRLRPAAGLKVFGCAFELNQHPSGSCGNTGQGEDALHCIDSGVMGFTSRHVERRLAEYTQGHYQH